MTDETAVEAAGLVKSYGDVTVLDGVDLRVRRGSVFALLGPNGAGKTTTVRILCTLAAADRGRACAGGSTSPPASSRAQPSSFSTSPRLAWTRAAGRRCGR
jgi:ABC-2 type transport system ATP-binding protein